MKTQKPCGGQKDFPVLVLISHGRFAEALLESAKLIAGENITDVITLCLEEGDNPGDFSEKLVRILKEGEEPKFVMADLYGGTPCNGAVFSIGKVGNNYEIVSGLNLPMLLEVLSMRGDTSIGELAAIAATAGKEGVRNVKEMVFGNRQ